MSEVKPGKKQSYERKPSIPCARKECDGYVWRVSTICGACRLRKSVKDVKKAVRAAGAASGTIYLDLETTGLSLERGAQVIEISIINDAGEILLDTLVKPEGSFGFDFAESQMIHKISRADVADAPTLDDLLPRIKEIVDQHTALVIYNSGFDLKFLPAEFREKSHCAAEVWARYAGNLNQRARRWDAEKLVDAARRVGHEWGDSCEHRALADAKALRSVWRFLRDDLVL